MTAEARTEPEPHSAQEPRVGSGSLLGYRITDGNEQPAWQRDFILDLGLKVWHIIGKLHWAIGPSLAAPAY